MIDCQEVAPPETEGRTFCSVAKKLRIIYFQFALLKHQEPEYQGMKSQDRSPQYQFWRRRHYLTSTLPNLTVMPPCLNVSEEEDVGARRPSQKSKPAASLQVLILCSAWAVCALVCSGLGYHQTAPKASTISSELCTREQIRNADWGFLNKLIYLPAN